MERHVLESVRSVVFKESENLEGSCTKIEGYDFNNGVDYSKLLKSVISTGFQASNLGDAIQVFNQMLDWRLSAEPIGDDCNEDERNPAFRKKCKVQYFSRLHIKSYIVWRTRNYSVSCSASHGLCSGYNRRWVEEDLIKCLAPTYKGDFSSRRSNFTLKRIEQDW